MSLTYCTLGYTYVPEIFIQFITKSTTAYISLLTYIAALKSLTITTNLKEAWAT